jgi:protein-disulfide isomerase
MTRGSFRPVGALGGLFFALALSLSAATLAAAPASTDLQSPGVRTLGSPKAPVTVIEYASVGCPHCAAWANTVFPEFKKQFVDTGKVQFVFHEMLTGDLDLAVAGFLLADCAPPEKYFDVVDAIFADQAGILQGGGPALFKIARDAGLTQDQFQACLTNEAALKSLQDRTERDASDHGVTATPTFIVGDQKLNGDIGLEALSAAIARARPKG